MPETTKKTLHQKLLDCRKKVEAIPKQGHNEAMNYDYVRDADVVKAVVGILDENKIDIIPSFAEAPQSNNGMTRVSMIYRIIDTDTGEEEVVFWFGDGWDKLDKGIYKAITGCRKYFLLNLLMIPTHDDPERDNTHDVEQSDMRGEIKNKLLEITGGDLEECASLIERFTSFTNKDGNRIRGKRVLEKVSEAQLPVLYRQVEEAYTDFLAEKV